MARQRLTFDEVAAAAASLHGEGKPVTIDALRGMIDTDSPNTMHKHLLTWRAGRAEPVEAPEAVLPETLAAALGGWAQQYAEEASAGVRAALAQAENDLAAESDARLAAEMELVGATTARDSLTAEINDLRAQLDACMAERSALRVEVQVLRAQGTKS